MMLRSMAVAFTPGSAANLSKGFDAVCWHCELGLGRLSSAVRSWQMLRHWLSTPWRVVVFVSCFVVCVEDIVSPDGHANHSSIRHVYTSRTCRASFAISALRPWGRDSGGDGCGCLSSIVASANFVGMCRRGRCKLSWCC